MGRAWLLGGLLLAVLGASVVWWWPGVGDRGADARDDAVRGAETAREPAPRGSAASGAAPADVAAPQRATVDGAAAAEPAPRDAARLTVRLLERGGRPAAGATLWVLTGAALERAGPPPAPDAPFPRDLPARLFGRAMVADAEGRVGLVRDFDEARLVAVRGELWAEGGWRVGDGDAVELVLESVPTVRAVARDPEGRPLPDVAVAVSHSVDGVPFPIQVAPTDAVGVAVLRLFPPAARALRRGRGPPVRPAARPRARGGAPRPAPSAA